MTNLPTLSPRAKKALDVLADGGSFCRRLERNDYTRREQWQYRLIDAKGFTIRGISLAAFYEIESFLRPATERSTSVSSYYKLRTA